MNVDDIIALGWKKQSQGGRRVLEERALVLSDFLKSSVTIEYMVRDSATLPIDEASSRYRFELALAVAKLDRASKAFNVITKELERRGSRNAGN